MTDDILRISIATGPPTSIVLEGDLDFSTSKALRRALDGVAQAADAIFDLSGLDFIDSSGLSVIATYARRIMPACRATVVVPQASMRRLFAVTALDSILTVVERAPA